MKSLNFAHVSVYHLGAMASACYLLDEAVVVPIHSRSLRLAPLACHVADVIRERTCFHGCTKCNLRKVMTLNASAKWRHQSRSASSPIFKSVGDVPPSPLQRAAARQPMMALLLGAIEAP